MPEEQRAADGEIDKPHHCEKTAQFAAFGDFKHVQQRAYCEQTKAYEYPDSDRLNSHRGNLSSNLCPALRSNTGQRAVCVH